MPLAAPVGFFGAQVGEPVLDGLVLWYDMDRGTSYVDGFDEFNNIGPDAPIADGVTFADNFEIIYDSGSLVNSVRFNQNSVSDFGYGNNLNNNEIANLPNAAMAGDFTFEAGFQTPGAVNDNVLYGVRLDQTLGGISRPGYGFRTDQFIFFGIAGYPFTSTTTDLLTSGSYHQLVCSCDNNNMAVYVDGAFTEDISISTSRPQVQDSGGTQVVGCNILGNAVSFVNGGTYNLNYLRIYNNNALDANEVLQNWNSKKTELGR